MVRMAGDGAISARWRALHDAAGRTKMARTERTPARFDRSAGPAAQRSGWPCCLMRSARGAPTSDNSCRVTDGG
jgi:hypothetical protein